MNLPSNTRPVMIVFDSKPGSRQKRRLKSRKPISMSSTERFAFIHVSHPQNQDEHCRRLIKTHVMKAVQRQAETPRAQNAAKIANEVSTLEDPSCNELHVRWKDNQISDRPSALLGNGIAFPIQMRPYMLQLLHKYAILMRSTRAEVTESTWFSLIVTDAALLHALLSTSAVCIAANSDAQLTSTFIQRKHMLESVKLINARLSGFEALSDTTIITVLFMAKSEYFHGNYNTWRVHMKGVRKMVELRGGIGMLPRLIQQKIYNLDLVGCIEDGTMPYFPIVDTSEPLSSPCMAVIPPSVNALVELYDTQQVILNLLRKIPASIAPQDAAFDETPHLLNQILSLYYRTRIVIPEISVLGETCDHHFLRIQRQVTEESLLLGAFFYLSLPHIPGVMLPTRPTNYEHLLHHLANYVDLLFTHYTSPEHSILLLWLLFLGEIFSFSPHAATSKFRTRLRAIMTEMCITEWEDMRSSLSALWWIESVYDDPYRQLWEMAFVYP